MTKGTVKWFNAAKGFGFITRQDISKDIFVHINDLKTNGINDLQDNQNVSFDIDSSNGKEKAINIKEI